MSNFVLIGHELGKDGIPYKVYYNTETLTISLIAVSNGKNRHLFRPDDPGYRHLHITHVTTYNLMKESNNEEDT